MTEPKDPFLDELLEGDLDALEQALSKLAEDAPSSSRRDALLQATTTTNRFPELVEALAKATDLNEDAAQDLLIAVDDASRWVDGPAPWIHLLHFEGGPATARSITGFVKVDPGQAFPEHGHLGDEIVIVLQGEAKDSLSGKVYRRGDTVTADPSIEHAVIVVSDIPLIYLAVVAEGIRLGGEDIPFDDPRA
ncbi:MAG: cupin domain-containing protein [Myxococcota bacterium]